MEWRRISDAFAPRPRGACVFMVLTLARETSPDGPHDAELTRWSTPWETWAAIGPRWWRLVHRLQRWCCAESGCAVKVKRGGRWVTRCTGACDRLAGRYVAVVEQHENGHEGDRWPHLNIVMHWPWLAERVRGSSVRLIPRGRGKADSRVLGPGLLLDTIVAAGFGYQSSAEIVRDDKAVAGYVAKHAAAVDRVTGEIAKRSQLPVDAPRGFRRIRSGRGFLDKPFTSGKDGALIRHDEWGNMFAVSRHRKDGAVWVAYGPPLFRPRERTLWLDMRHKRAYLPDWPGWNDLPSPSTDRELDEWMLVLDVQRGPPQWTIRDASPRIG